MQSKVKTNFDIFRFFANEILEQPGDWQMLAQRIEHAGFAYLETTGSYVAKNLPFYTVNFDLKK